MAKFRDGDRVFVYSSSSAHIRTKGGAYGIVKRVGNGHYGVLFDNEIDRPVSRPDGLRFYRAQDLRAVKPKSPCQSRIYDPGFDGVLWWTYALATDSGQYQMSHRYWKTRKEVVDYVNGLIPKSRKPIVLRCERIYGLK